MSQIGIVAIGRNEGQRLKRCLQGIKKQSDLIVYVDSGSADDSMAIAKNMGISTIQLDMETPFSAGRARNEGFFSLIQRHTSVQYVQFVDGDCELVDGWLSIAAMNLEADKHLAVVAGLRKERNPDLSIYNLLCDIEWNTPVGYADSCGGDFMVRVKAFQQVKGFNPVIIAGEEPELCYRLRRDGWKICRLDHLMTLHDASITRFSQWWKRTMRSGYAYAQGFALHGTEEEKFCFRDSLSIWWWAFLFPLSVVLLTLMVNSLFSLFLITYLVQFVKIVVFANKKILNCKNATFYGFFVFIGKFPQLIGQIMFFSRMIKKADQVTIEY